MRAVLSLILVGLISVPARAQSDAPTPRIENIQLGERVTQRILLEPGHNFVSLFVQPTKRDFESLFGDGLAHVISVRDGEGGVFSPRFDIRTITEWEPAQAYTVDVDEPLEWAVAGLQIEPETEIILAKGWNDVAFPFRRSVPVDSAIASISESLEQIQSPDGQTYPARGKQTALASIEPGLGYRLRLSRVDTLSYASGAPAPPQTPPTEADFVVATIGDALALQGLSVGQTVSVGDPVRGGIFEVTDSGRPSDGGTIFIPTQHTAKTTASRLGESQTLFDGEDGGIDFGSFQLFYGPGAGDYLGAVELHGHGAPNPGRYLDTRTGRLRVSRDLGGTHSATYRYATSSLRLERVVPPLVLEGKSTSNYVRPEWWGGVPYPAGWTPNTSAPSAPGATPSGIVVGDPVYDATDELATAINAASDRAVSTNREHYVVLSGMYGYARVIEMQDRVVLKGQVDGLRSDPGDRIRQGLMVMKGAPWHKWAVKSTVDPVYAEEKTPQDRLLGGGGDPFVVVRHGRLSNVNRLVDIELDGNVAENAYVLSDGYRTASGPAGNPLWEDRVAEMLQNTSHWNGFSAYVGNTSEDVTGSRATLENVHVHDYGGNILLGAAPVSFGGSRDLKLGNTVKNHILYRTFTGSDWIDGIEVYGYTWASYLELQQGNFRNVHVHSLENNPWFEDTQYIFGHRNDALSAAELEGNQRAYYFGDDVNVETVRVELEKNRPRQGIFDYDTARLTYRDVTVDNNTGTVVQLFNSDGGDADQVERSFFRIENVVAERGGIQSLTPGKARLSVVRGGLTTPGEVAAGSSKGVRYRVNSPSQAGAAYDLGSAAQPFAARRPVTIADSGVLDQTLSVFVQRSFFRDVEQPLRVEGANASDPAVQARLAVYWRDVEFSQWSPDSYQLQYFERVTDLGHGGRKSEARGSLSQARLTASGDGRYYIDLQPGLFFTPQANEFVSVTVSSGPAYLGWASRSAWDSNDPTLRLYFSGPGPVSASWTAAIRPIPGRVVFPD